MTDLQAQVRAAIQSIRTSTPRVCGVGCYAETRDEYRPMHSPRCEERWQVKVDARLAACVEAAIDATIRCDGACGAEEGCPTAVAAFLAAATQEENV